jgi:purine-binding chemotaxis protein CheW
VSGYLTFSMGGRELAAPLDQVLEIVRAVGIEALPGARAPVSGLVQVRGQALPVVDLRGSAYPGGSGDLVVLAGRPDSPAPGPVAVAVDRVLAVSDASDYAPSDSPVPPGLPGYVTALLRRVGDGGPASRLAPDTVFEVDLWALAGFARVESTTS